MEAELVVAGQQDFGNDVALHSVELEVILGTQIVEAVDLVLASVVGAGAVLVNDRVAIAVELEADVAAGLHLVLVLG